MTFGQNQSGCFPVYVYILNTVHTVSFLLYERQVTLSKTERRAISHKAQLDLEFDMTAVVLYN